MSSVEIRRMRSADLPRVMLIELSTFTMPWSEATFRGLLRRKDWLSMMSIAAKASAAC
jgi:hypothetical protein